MSENLDKNIILKVDNLTKKFCRNLKRSMLYGIIDIAKSVLGVNYNKIKLRKDEFFALKNVSFELKKGETLGIIGINGSGKSTLLRLISGIFLPDQGMISYKGRIGSLIAVGAGFHPNMTGRENIYLNGIILGMKKKEIDDKINDIINFADIGDFLEAPVSTYSSGMRVRLGFAIAVHSEPDILLVDEVLSVGDVDFRAKCIGKIEEIRNKTSIIFISHNMLQVESICDRCILMHKGKVFSQGNTKEVIADYFRLNIKKSNGQSSDTILLEVIKGIEDVRVQFLDENKKSKESFNTGENLLIKFSITASKEFKEIDIHWNLSFIEGINLIVNKSSMDDMRFNIKKGINEFYCLIEQLPLLKGSYSISFNIRGNKNTRLASGFAQNLAVLMNKKDFSNTGIVKIKSRFIEMRGLECF